MNVQQFQGCCGAYILYDFGWTVCTQGTTVRIDKKEIDKWIKLQVVRFSSSAFLIIILNGNQTEELKGLMIKNRFYIRSRGKHEGHQGITTMYIRSRKDN